MARDKVKLTYDERRIIMMSLIELKNKLIAEGRYTDAIDDILLKLWVCGYIIPYEQVSFIVVSGVKKVV